MKTLPELCRDDDLPLDHARELLRARPDLAGLAVKYGANRVFDADAAAKIVEAMEEKLGLVKN